MDQDSIVFLDEAPRRYGNTGGDELLNRCDLRRINGRPAITDYSDYARYLENVNSILDVKPAEDVSREKWALNHFHSIGPLGCAAVERKELLIAFPLKTCLNHLLVS